MPAGGAQTPAITRFQAFKSLFRSWRAKVVSPGLGKHQKLFGDLRADGVAACVFGAGFAAAVTGEAGQWLVLQDCSGVPNTFFAMVQFLYQCLVWVYSSILKCRTEKLVGL